VLLFRTLSEQHSGSYTCLATNAAATTNHTATLSVQVSPKWIVQPGRREGLVGDTVTLPCSARGVPAPKITWLTATGPGANNFTPLTNSHTHHGARYTGPPARYQSDNGSLVFPVLSKSDQGWYRCEASNGVGGDIGHNVQVSVHAGAQVVSPGGRVTGLSGQLVTLTCQAVGDPPLTLHWTKGDHPLPSEGRFSIRESPTTDGGLSTVLRVSPVSPPDGGEYRCTASNRHGSHTAAYTVAVLEPPQPPSDVRISDVTSHSATVAWVVPHPATVWLQYTGECGCSTRVSVAAVHGQDGWFLLPSLYCWLLVEFIKRGKALVELLTLRAFEGELTLKALGSGSGGEEQYVVRGLVPGTLYEVAVHAFNKAGLGPPSSPRVVRATLPDVPRCPPTSPTCRGSGPNSVRVTWDPPHPHCGGSPSQIVGYSLTLIPTSPVRGIKGVEVTTSNLEKGVSGLPSSTNISVRVTAVNRAGHGPPSPPCYCAPLHGVPTAPPSPRGVVTGDQRALVSWALPRPSQGDLLHFTLYTHPRGHVSPPPGHAGPPRGHTVQREHIPVSGMNSNWRELTDLLTGVPVQVWVTASTSAGEGPPSPRITLTPTRTPTHPPLILGGGGEWWVTRGGGLTLGCRRVGEPAPIAEWDRDGGALGEGEQLLPGGDVHLTGYTVHYRLPSGSWQEQATAVRISADAVSSSAELRWLPCGTAVHIYTTAFNQYGASPASDVIVGRTSGYPPPRPDPSSLIEFNSTCVTLRLYTWPERGCPIQSWKVGSSTIHSSPQTTSSTDKTVLFWQLLPNKTLTFRGERCTGGKKSKQRITLLVGANMSSSEKFPLLAIGNYMRPREEEISPFEEAQRVWSIVRKFMQQRSGKPSVMQACKRLDNEMHMIHRKKDAPADASCEFWSELMGLTDAVRPAEKTEGELNDLWTPDAKNLILHKGPSATAFAEEPIYPGDSSIDSSCSVGTSDCKLKDPPIHEPQQRKLNQHGTPKEKLSQKQTKQDSAQKGYRQPHHPRQVASYDFYHSPKLTQPPQTHEDGSCVESSGSQLVDTRNQRPGESYPPRLYQRIASNNPVISKSSQKAIASNDPLISRSSQKTIASSNHSNPKGSQQPIVSNMHGSADHQAPQDQQRPQYDQKQLQYDQKQPQYDQKQPQYDQKQPQYEHRGKHLKQSEQRKHRTEMSLPSLHDTDVIGSRNGLLAPPSSGKQLNAIGRHELPPEPQQKQRHGLKFFMGGHEKSAFKSIKKLFPSKKLPDEMNSKFLKLTKLKPGNHSDSVPEDGTKSKKPSILSDEKPQSSSSNSSLISGNRVYRPPSLFSDSRELSEAECDRYDRENSLDSARSWDEANDSGPPLYGEVGGFCSASANSKEEAMTVDGGKTEELTVILNRIYEQRASNSSQKSFSVVENTPTSESEKSSYSINV
ncbi:Fibronectin type III, partial [Trinorchestia longiramus]